MNIIFPSSQDAFPWHVVSFPLESLVCVHRTCIRIYRCVNAIGISPSFSTEDRSVDGYEIGLYNLTIVVTDWLGFVSTDTVWVEVIPVITTTTPVDTVTTTNTTTSDLLGTITLLISIGSIGIIMIVIVLIIRKT